MRPKSKQVDPYPVMPRGATEFEEKWIACDFELVFKKISEAGLSSLKQTYELAYRSGFIAGKTRALNQKSNVAVANNAEPQKGQNT